MRLVPVNMGIEEPALAARISEYNLIATGTGQ